jgi:hypothetical protein
LLVRGPVGFLVRFVAVVDGGKAFAGGGRAGGFADGALVFLGERVAVSMVVVRVGGWEAVTLRLLLCGSC